MVKMDKASISAKSYEEQQKEDKANKSRNFLSAGFSWLKTQFASGSHHVVEQAKPSEPILVQPVAEKPIEIAPEKSKDKKNEKQPEKSVEKSEHEHKHKHRHKHKSLSKSTGRKALKNPDEQSSAKFNTVSERPHSRKKNRHSDSHVSFNLDATEVISGLSGSEEGDLMPPPVKKNTTLIELKSMELLEEHSEPVVQVIEPKAIESKEPESKTELPEAIQNLSIVSETLDQPLVEKSSNALVVEETPVPVPVMFEPVSKVKELKQEEQLQTMLEVTPDAVKAEGSNQSESEEPREDFSRAIRHRAFEKHRRNSQRLSGQLPNYDEQAFIDGGRDVDFIRIQNGTGRYWNHPGRPGQVAGQINHDVMDGMTYQRLGYLASLGDAEAHEKIEAAKNRNGTYRK